MILWAVDGRRVQHVRKKTCPQNRIARGLLEVNGCHGKLCTLVIFTTPPPCTGIGPKQGGGEFVKFWPRPGKGPLYPSDVPTLRAGILFCKFTKTPKPLARRGVFPQFSDCRLRPQRGGVVKGVLDYVVEVFLPPPPTLHSSPSCLHHVLAMVYSKFSKN